MLDPVVYIFGYGSLVSPEDQLVRRSRIDQGEPIYGRILDHRRHWDMAMNNVDPRHDHKHFVDADGVRPAIKVASLGLEHATGVNCNGIAVPVPRSKLDEFDRRENLYERRSVDVGGFEPRLRLPLFTYYPRLDSLLAFDEGVRDGNVFLARSYWHVVTSAFYERGPEIAAEYEASTRAPRCRIVDLHLRRASGAAGI